MKLLVIGDEARVRKYLPDLPIVDSVEVAVASRGTSDEELMRIAGDADFVMADAISPVTRGLMESMPNLRLVHSEGVAFDSIDTDAAKELGIAVCNNAGVNASGVAEQAILLMLACLRDAVAGDADVRTGRQIQKKERMMVEGIRELGDCKVGLVGFGAIAKALACRLKPFGCEILYNKRTPIPDHEEKELGISFATKDEIARECDIVSIHVPVTDETRGMVDAGFLASMKPGAILVNTARGEVVDNEALAAALEAGKIAKAGLDTIHPEPVKTDNPLLNLSSEASARLVLSPHVGGVTEGMFYRAHRAVWENIARIVAGEEPMNRVA